MTSSRESAICTVTCCSGLAYTPLYESFTGTNSLNPVWREIHLHRSPDVEGCDRGIERPGSSAATTAGFSMPGYRENLVGWGVLALVTSIRKFLGSTRTPKTDGPLNPEMPVHPDEKGVYRRNRMLKDGGQSRTMTGPRLTVPRIPSVQALNRANTIFLRSPSSRERTETGSPPRYPLHPALQVTLREKRRCTPIDLR